MSQDLVFSFALSRISVALPVPARFHEHRASVAAVS